MKQSKVQTLWANAQGNSQCHQPWLHSIWFSGELMRRIQYLWRDFLRPGQLCWSYWTSHKLNTESQGPCFTPNPIRGLGSLEWSCSSQPQILPCICGLVFSINLCVLPLSLPLLLACLLQPLVKTLGLQGMTVAQRQAHSLHIRNTGSQNILFKMLVLLSIFSLQSSCSSKCLASLRSKQMKANKKIIKAT